MEYADSLWAHLGGDTDVSSQSEVDQWLDKLLDEAEEDNLDTEGVDNEPIAETTWNAAARHIQRRQAILQRTASGEPAWVEAARRIVANKTYESVDGVMFDLFSASAVLQVYEALSEENKEKFGSFSLPAAVNVAFKLINTQKASRRERQGGMVTPMSRKQAAGQFYVSVYRREDGSVTYKGPYTDEADAKREADAWNGAESSIEGRSWRAKVVSGPEAEADFAAWEKATTREHDWEDPKRYFPYSSSRKQAKSARDVVAGDVISGPGSGYSPTGTDSGTVSKVDSTTTPGTVYIYFGDHGPPADLIFNHGDPVRISEASKRTAAEKYRIVQDVGSPGKWVVQKYYPDNQLYHDVGDAVDSRQAAEEKLTKIQSEGSRRTAEEEKVHKATPQDESLGVSTCRHCGNAVKRVPGGQGSTWVHTDTGAVAGSGGPRESSRRTAADPDLREIEQWCDSQGLVMKDFPDSLIDRAAESGDTSILDEWLETHDPLTETDAGNPFNDKESSRRYAVDEAVEHDDITAVEGTGEDDEEELYDDWVHDDNGYDPSVDDPDRWRWQSGQTGVSSFATRTALTSVDDDELIDWEKRKRDEDEGLVEWGDVKPQTYQRELKTRSDRRG